MKGRGYTLSEKLTREDVIYLFDNYNELKVNIGLIESALKYVTSQAYIDEQLYAIGVKTGSGGAPTTGTVSDKTFNAAVNIDIACHKEQKELQRQLSLLSFIIEQIDVYIANLPCIDKEILTSRYKKQNETRKTLSLVLDNHSRQMSKSGMQKRISHRIDDFMAKTLIKKQDLIKLTKLLDNN